LERLLPSKRREGSDVLPDHGIGIALIIATHDEETSTEMMCAPGRSMFSLFGGRAVLRLRLPRDRGKEKSCDEHSDVGVASPGHVLFPSRADSGLPLEPKARVGGRIPFTLTISQLE
jgi:hypothetical protein